MLSLTLSWWSAQDCVSRICKWRVVPASWLQFSISVVFVSSKSFILKTIHVNVHVYVIPKHLMIKYILFSAWIEVIPSYELIYWTFSPSHLYLKLIHDFDLHVSKDFLVSGPNTQNILSSWHMPLQDLLMGIHEHVKLSVSYPWVIPMRYLSVINYLSASYQSVIQPWTMYK